LFTKILSILYPIGNKILPNKIKFKIADRLGDSLHEVILENNEGSMIPKERIAFMLTLLEKCVNSIEGDVIECGVYKGGSLKAIAKKMKLLKSNKKIYGLDTFEGFKFDDNDFKFDEFEKCYPDGKAPKVKGTHQVDFNKLKNEFKGLDNVIFFKGLFEESFPKLENKKFCFAHVDADLYISIKQSIQFLKNKMNVGGIIYFDDYNSEHWPAATKAINEELGKESLIKLEKYQAYWIKK
jgi:O-methyltransferase